MKFFVFLSLASFLVFTSCDTGDAVTGDEETTSSQDNDFSDSEFSRMASHFDAQARVDPDLYGKTGKSLFCPNADVVGTKTGTDTYSLEIDFGTNCSCLDGRARSGKLSAQINGKWLLPGASMEITPANYSVKGLNGTTYSVTFDKTITINQPKNGNFNFTTTTANAVFTPPSGGAFSWEATYTTEWIGGQTTLTDPTDNIYSITGSGNGNASNDVNYTVSIAKALIIKGDCAYVAEGVLELTPDGKQTRSLDYGDRNTCDNKATFSVGGFSQAITLR